MSRQDPPPRRSKPPRLSKGAKWLVALGILLGLSMCGSIWPVANTSLRQAAEVASQSPTESPRAAAPPLPPDPTSFHAKHNSQLWVLFNKLGIDDKPPGGYKRSLFGQPWSDVDHNGCDQRNDVLRRDMVQRHTKPGTRGCILASGRLKDDRFNYAAKPVKFVRGDKQIQIDHVVSLHNAWESGAYGWGPDERKTFANDFMNLEAIDSGSNQDKSDATFDEWKPTDGLDACVLAGRMVSVKARYKLTVTTAEQQALAAVLFDESCRGGEKKLFKPSQFEPPVPKPMGEPKPQTMPYVVRGVWVGARCTIPGQPGVTLKGTPVRCVKQVDGSARWRAR
jgi:Protein of unknown function (DUF1524)